MLIAFEGLDQSGKETQARHLRARIEQEGLRVHALSFPDYGTPIGQEIEKALHGEREFTPEVMQPQRTQAAARAVDEREAGGDLRSLLRVERGVRRSARP